MNYTVSSLPHHMNLHHTGNQMAQRTMPDGRRNKDTRMTTATNLDTLREKGNWRQSWDKTENKRESGKLHFELGVAIIQFILEKAVLIF